MNEIKRLEDIAADSWYNKGLNLLSIKYNAKIFKRSLKKGSLLEMGPAEGIMTENLIDYFDDYTIVEGSSLFCKKLKNQFPSINIFNSLFEDFKSNKNFDNILLGHVLEHVENPIEILSNTKQWLNKGGVLMASVPNAYSLHRQAAVELGLLKSIYELNSTDLHHGHRRVYDIKALENDFKKAGLKITHKGGYWIKPLSNKQLEETWTEEMINTYMKLGEKYPEIAAEIYVIATK